MKAQIEAVLDRIRPALEMHGGDVEIAKIDKKAKILYVRFHGNCTHCAISEITLKHLIEKEVTKTCPEILSVVAESM